MILVDVTLGPWQHEIYFCLFVLYTNIQQNDPLSPCIWKTLLVEFESRVSFNVAYFYLMMEKVD